VQLYVLGAPRILVAEVPARMPYQKVVALVAYLAVTARPHSREALATLLWSEVDDQRAQNSLRNALYVTRRLLAPTALVATADRQVALDLEQVWLDLNQFQTTVDDGESTIAALNDALDLWRGPFLDGLLLKDAPDFNAWVTRTREQLERHHRQGYLALSQMLEEAGQWDEAVDAARRALTIDGLHEAGHRQVMRLYLRMGNRVGALQQYEACQAMLLEELGVAPDARTHALRERALRRTPTRFPAGDSLPGTKARQPVLFVGRQREMAALNAHLRAVRREAVGRLVLVEGEAGIGKTRLVNEWLSTLRHTQVLFSRCFEAERSIPYRPWTDMLRSSLDRVDWEGLDLPDLWLAELSHLVPELRTRIPDIPLSVPFDPELARGRLAEAIHQWFRTLGGRWPICLFLDDLQWIDRASLALLEYVLRHSVGLPLMLIGTQREREVDPSWQRTQAVLTRAGLCHRMTLYRLSFPEVAAIAHHVGFRAADSDLFLKRLFRETEGNPLFVVEILRSLPEGDVDASGAWPIPATVKDVVQGQIDRLNVRTRQTLAIAAVIGRTFDSTTLQTVTGRQSEITLSALEEGMAAGLIVEQDAGYDFSHNQIRAVLYNRITQARRRHLHLRVAEALETLHGDDLSPHLGTLAHHFGAAGEGETACQYALRAAKQAVELYADEDALTWYDRAGALSETTRAELPADIVPRVIPFHQYAISSSLPLDVPGLVHRQKGLIHQRRGQYGVAKRLFRQALARARERGRLDEQAAAHGLLSFLAYLRGDYDELAEHAQASLELATSVGGVALQAEGLRNLGIAAYRTGAYERAIELYRASLAASRSIDDRASVAKSYNNIGFALRTMGRFEDAVGSFGQALELHQATGSIEGAAGVLANIGGVYLRSGDLEQALDTLQRAISRSEACHADWVTAKATRTLGSVYMRAGRWEQALRAAERARELAESLGSKEDLGAAYRLLGEIATGWPESGLGPADTYFERSLALLRSVGERYELERTESSLAAYRRTRG
jgi:DNA-binding SARP family transcriptional activator/Tfp pilus assembly protein PilF